MIFEDNQSWLKAMEDHKCSNKSLIPADNATTDIFTAKMEGREPRVFPKKVFVCSNCGEMFEIELRKAISKYKTTR